MDTDWDTLWLGTSDPLPSRPALPGCGWRSGASRTLKPSRRAWASATGATTAQGRGSRAGRTATGGYWTKGIGLADDHEDANGSSVLTFWQAQDRARALVRGGSEQGERPATVAEALEHYAADLKARGSGTANARRVKSLLPQSLGRKAVAALGARELRQWRDGLLARMKASSADRTARMMKAALNLAAKDDPRIVNANAWKTGLARLQEAEPPANKIIDDKTVRRIVAAARDLDPQFGLLVETLATTGARPSQALRLEAADVQDGDAPRLMMPSSRKGRRRSVARQPVPIPQSLALALMRRSDGRDRGALVFGGQSSDRAGRTFRQLAASLRLDAGVSLYSLRHSSIVRQLLAGVPTRVVAAHHDTSVPVLEHTYSRHISTISDSVVRRALIDLGGR